MTSVLVHAIMTAAGQYYAAVAMMMIDAVIAIGAFTLRLTPASLLLFFILDIINGH